ncbi:hypothetical protein ETAA8_05340 [Anatilimnocola aggregata]|uniref:Uncharacterized protein n=1 Tax=Anatilimnocola aggregata TaxID=2528021 RepID=A0A517Y5J1_9BACT|nr:hypothetical protein [Anatilimnocola aggregata]QDU25466.1 hypothetical protein ETAA8_05340 [Anatilimnocola aggregata]
MNSLHFFCSLLGYVALCCLFPCSILAAEVEPESAFTPSEGFQTWVTEIVRDQLPEDYEKSKNWGNTTRTFAGWKVERDGLKIETRRRWKEANDGTWTRYRVTPLNPDKHFAVRVEKLEQLEGNRIRLQLTAISKLRLFGRMSQWEHGVQLLSTSAEADAKVRVRGTVEIALKLDPTKFPPDVFIVPEVTDADFAITEFELRRLGQFDGPLVRSLSDDTRAMLADELAARRPKLVASLNKKLAKQQDKLKFSFSDLLKSEWGKFVPADLSADESEK